MSVTVLGTVSIIVWNTVLHAFAKTAGSDAIALIVLFPSVKALNTLKSEFLALAMDFPTINGSFVVFETYSMAIRLSSRAGVESIGAVTASVTRGKSAP